MARRNKPDLVDQLERAERLDIRLRDITAERDDIRRQVNELSKQVATLRRGGDEKAAEQAMAESRALGEREDALAEEFEQVSQTLHQALLMIPNLPHPDVVSGTGDHDNPVRKGPINMPVSFADHQRVPHWETGERLGILDNERAVKISGAMFTMQLGAGATLARALCQFALDMNADAFEEVRPPSLVTTATLTALWLFSISTIPLIAWPPSLLEPIGPPTAPASLSPPNTKVLQRPLLDLKKLPLVTA